MSKGVTKSFLICYRSGTTFVMGEIFNGLMICYHGFRHLLFVNGNSIAQFKIRLDFAILLVADATFWVHFSS